MCEKLYWKIIPWGAKLGSNETMELIDHLDNLGLTTELEYFEDRDNGRIPRLIIWGDNGEETTN